MIDEEAEQEEAQAEVGESTSVRPEPAALGAPHDVTIPIPADETRNLSCGGQAARPDAVAETAHASLDRLQALGVRSFLSDSERTSQSISTMNGLPGTRRVLYSTVPCWL